MDKAAFLARLPESHIEPPARPQGPPEPPPVDALETLVQKLQATGMGVHQINGAEAAVEHALTLVKQSGADRLGVSDLGPELNKFLQDAAKSQDVEVVSAGDDRGKAQSMDLLSAGLTRAELAVAQVGALVQVARPGGGRLLSLMPPLHIALLHSGDVLPTMADVPIALHDPKRFPEGMPPAVSLIGGPSKTGDIEAVIVLGVHGPGRVEVVIWD
jgi:L-lactate dehydrogenase complex protein LldG